MVVVGVTVIVDPDNNRTERNRGMGFPVPVNELKRIKIIGDFVLTLLHTAISQCPYRKVCKYRILMICLVLSILRIKMNCMLYSLMTTFFPLTMCAIAVA